MRNALTVGTCVFLLVLTGCTGSPSAAPPAPTAEDTAPVIAPGRPGEEARTLSPSEAATAVPSQQANATDVRFMQNMIVHHRQALDMSLMAPTRASDEAIKRLASRINQVQGPEIAMMTDWLKSQGQQVPEHHAAHQNMPGMATPEQLAGLKAATGTAFDELFVQLMTAHHQGAIVMSTEEITKGSHLRVQEIAEDIAVSQAAEIRRMRQLLK
ncbi:DUF305 domain-containing protein [Nonomuraea rhizosphaerae]|uniref:DUF305 domain-containing protein n=1 Tax=Nonomuraea rhizosphaerae TaxID=2665663 RepID=UPI001C5FA5B7|nr:DUF305 domain-containing protein [Nonomuraea rhizosphaerae]